ncbi:Rne/Rng family ribonuclease [Cryobacterium sp. Y57]|uniref:Rne/Rng family ribonuclease n=1 Tax=Cryobacterium sp. Y57 TaxID=2048287 RepID=UPI001E37B388|nr:Rne/Rng family ribonuclease [Cryobacterium sp. Y57]
MVEDNENKKRKSLFGPRKSTRKAPVTRSTAPAIEAPAASVTAEPATAEPIPAKTTIAEYNNVTGAQQMTGVTSANDTASDGSVAPAATPVRPSLSLLFQAPEILPMMARTGIRSAQESHQQERDLDDDEEEEATTVRRRARRRTGDENRSGSDDPANTVVKVRAPREPELITEPQRIKGSTRLEAKKQRRRDGRDAGRRRPVITEAEFLARRESVDRLMVVRAKHNKIQIGVLEDGVLVEHYVAKNQDASLIGNVYLGRVQNVLPSMEAAFVDIGRGRNAVLYSGEVDWDAAAENSGSNNQARRIELALKPGDKVLVQVTKDPIGHKGARLTSQVSLPGRYLVYVPNGSMNGISRKLPDTERARLKKILKEVLPDNVGVIVRTAAEGATDEQLTVDVNRLREQWAHIAEQVESAQAPAELHSEPDLLVKIVRDVFNEDFQRMVVAGPDVRSTIETYLSQVAPDLLERIETYEGEIDSFDQFRISEQIEKALDRKVWLPSGGSLVIDRTEAMTVVDVNTGKFVGSGGNLEETVTKNNLEAAEEIVRQLRLRDIGGIIVVDFIDMVLESNRDLVSRRLIECLSRDRTKHQVAEVTSLGLVQMTRKKLGLGLLESFSEDCESCAGRGIIVHHDPVTKHRQTAQPPQERRPRAKGGSNAAGANGGGNNGVGNGRDNSGQRDGFNRDAHSGSSAGFDAPKSGQGTHGITEDAKQALALIAARTITRTGSIAIIPASDTRAADAGAAKVVPVTTGTASTGTASAEAVTIEAVSTELAGTELAGIVPAGTLPAGDGPASTEAVEPTNTERSRGRQSRSRGQGGRGQQSRSEQARARQASTEQASTEQASTEQASTEQASTEQASTEQASTEQASTEQASTEQASTEQASTEQASTEQASTEQASTEQASTEQASTEQASTEQASTEQASTEQASTEQASTEQASTEQASTEQASTEQASTEQASTEQASTEQASTEQASTEQASTEQASTEQASTEQASTEQASTEQASTEQASTEQASTEQASTEQASTEQTGAELGNIGQTNTGQTNTEQVDAAVLATPGTEPVVGTVTTAGAPRTRGGRSALPAGAPAVQSPVQSPVAVPSLVDVQSLAADIAESVDILDIPVKKASRTAGRPSKQVTDQLLDSVLDSLPEPKLPGQGRARSRRVTTAGGSGGQAILTKTGTATSASAPSQLPPGE